MFSVLNADVVMTRSCNQRVALKKYFFLCLQVGHILPNRARSWSRGSCAGRGRLSGECIPPGG